MTLEEQMAPLIARYNRAPESERALVRHSLEAIFANLPNGMEADTRQRVLALLGGEA